MDFSNPPTSKSTKSKFAKTFSKCLHPQTPSRYFPNQQPHNVPPSKQLPTLSEELNISIKDFKSKNQPKLFKQKSTKSHSSGGIAEKKPAKEALISKLFASISSIKASYAELQSAQFPYNSDVIQSADAAIVSELVVLSELKLKYSDDRLDLPPAHVTRLLAEIQEQQSNIKTYGITMKQLQLKLRKKETDIVELRNKLEEILKGNKSLEKRVSSSGKLICPLGNNVSFSDLNPTHLIRVLNQVLRYLNQFVKALVSEMVEKNWDLDLAAKAIIEPTTTLFGKQIIDKIFPFEAYICSVMFDGFNNPNFNLLDENAKQGVGKNVFFDKFIKLQSMTATQIIAQNPKSGFAKFCKGKYLKLLHPKMECSMFGNLDQRKAISLGAFPETEFFYVFAEMARRVWLLHCLAFSFDPPAVAFEVRRGCRFSEVYMESVTAGEDGVVSGDVTVAFTVVPGFKIGKTVVQSRVYLCPPKS